MGNCQSKQTVHLSKEVHSQYDFRHWVKLHTQIQHSPGLFQPISYRYISQSFCSISDHIMLQYPAYKHTLQEEIQSRIKEQRYFQQHQVRNLAKSLLQSCQHVKVIGDIRPAQIMLSESGEPMCIGIFSWPYEFTPFRKALRRENQVKYFLAPEESSALKEGMEMFCYDEKKADLYRIGLTLIQTCLLLNKLPQNNYHQIQRKTLLTLITQVGGKYAGMNGVIQKMTNPMPQKRASPSQLLNVLKKLECSENLSSSQSATANESLIELEQQLDQHIEQSLELLRKAGIN